MRDGQDTWGTASRRDSRELGSELGGRFVSTVEPAILLELLFNHMPALVFMSMFLIVRK